MAIVKPIVLFDTAILENSLKKKAARTGIYFTAFNIFRNIIARNDVTIILYTQQKRRLHRYLRMYFPDQRNRLAIVTDHTQIDRLDAYFSAGDFGNDAIRKKFPGASCYSILYDIIPMIHPEYFNFAAFPSMISMLNDFDKVDHGFSISESTRNDILSFTDRISPGAISVVPLGANERYYHDADPDTFARIRTKYKIPQGKYILSLCTREPRKNLISAIRAFIAFIDKYDIHDLTFVLAGGMWDTFKKTLEGCIDNLGRFRDRIVETGYVDDADVASLYSNAEWFVYTSHYEGFGLPPLEAMQCGCPVVTSNNSSLPEVVGDAGLMVDSFDIDSHVEAFRQYYFDEALRRENSRKGLERAKLFSWQRCTEVIVEKITSDALRKHKRPLVVAAVVVNYDAKTSRYDDIQACFQSVLKQQYADLATVVYDCSYDETTSNRLKENAALAACLVPLPKHAQCADAVKDCIARCDGEYYTVLLPDMRYRADDVIATAMMKGLEFDADIVRTDFAGLRENDSELENGGLPFAHEYPTGCFFFKASSFKDFSPAYSKEAYIHHLLIDMLHRQKRIVRVWMTALAYDGQCQGESYRREFIQSCHDSIGKDAGLSLSDMNAICTNRFLNVWSDARVFSAAKQLPVRSGGLTLCERLFAARYYNKTAFANQSAWANDAKHKLFGLIPLHAECHGNPDNYSLTYSLFRSIPLLKITKRGDTRRSYYLFGVVPLLRSRNG